MAKSAMQILVRLQDEASKPASRIAKALRDIGQAAKLSGGKGLDLKVNASSTRNLDAMVRSASRLTREFQAAQKAAAGIRLPSGGASPFGAMRKDAAAFVRDLERARALYGKLDRRGGGSGGAGRYRPPAGRWMDDYPERYRRRRGGGGGHYDGGHEAASYAGTRVAGATARGAGRVASIAAHVGADSMRESSRDTLAGLTEEESARVSKRAEGLSQRYPSVDTNTAHEMLRDTAMSMGSVDKAFENADNLGKMATVLQSLKGKDKAIEQVRQFYSGLDVLGKNVDPKQVGRLSDAYTKALGVEGAEMDMGKVLTLAKNAKSGGAALNEKFLTTTVPALMQDLGHHQTGTALSSMVGQIIGGRGTKKSAAYQRELGMRDDRGRIPEADKKMITENPFEYTMKRFIPMLKAKGIDPDDETKVIEATSKAFSNSKVADLFAKMVTQRAQYHRKEEQYDKAPGLKAADTLRSKDPYVAAEGAIAQAKNLASQNVAPFMQLATDAINKATDAMVTAGKFFSERPDAAKVTGPAAAGIAATLGSYLGGKTLLAAASKSNGLWSGAARLLGGGLLGANAVGATGAPLVGGTAAGVALDEGMNRAMKGGSQPFTMDQAKAYAEAQRKSQDADAGKSWSEFLGEGLRNFLHGSPEARKNLPAYAPQQHPDVSGERQELPAGPPQAVPLPPQRPGAPYPAAPQEAPAAPASTAAPSAAPVNSDAIEQATAALAKYEAELTSVKAQIEGLRASGEGAFSPDAAGLESKKAELETAISGMKSKIESLNGATVAPKFDASGLAPVDSAVETTRGKIESLNGATVAPKGDTSQLQPVVSMLQQIVGLIGQIDGGLGGLQGKAAGVLSTAKQAAGAAKAGSAAPASSGAVGKSATLMRRGPDLALNTSYGTSTG